MTKTWANFDQTITTMLRNHKDFMWPKWCEPWWGAKAQVWAGLGWLHLHGLILAYEQTPLFRFYSSSESQSYLFLVFLQKIENSIIIIHWLCFSESDRPYLLFYIIIMYASIISYVSIKQCYVREEINIWNYSTLNKILDFHSWAVYDKSHRVHY